MHENLEAPADFLPLCNNSCVDKRHGITSTRVTVLEAAVEIGDPIFSPFSIVPLSIGRSETVKHCPRRAKVNLVRKTDTVQVLVLLSLQLTQHFSRAQISSGNHNSQIILGQD